MIVVLTSFFVGLLAGWLIWHTRDHHAMLTADSEMNGPQKIHTAPVPRVGGLIVFAGFLVGVSCAAFSGVITHLQGFAIALCGVPVFLAGLREDVTKKGNVLFRLFASFASAALGFWLLDARLTRLDAPFLDMLLVHFSIAFVFTLFAVGGVVQSLNIIDGLNGLAAMVSMLILAAFGVIGWKLGDQLIWALALAALGGVASFFVWNYPRGRIFCGDGGAYFLGFLISELSILLVHRHSEVSAWFPLVLVAYPVWETLFSIYRRVLWRKRAAMHPDALHMHSLVYRRLSRLSDGRSRDSMSAWRTNATSSAICWALPVLSSAGALIWWDSTWRLVLVAFVFATLYVICYVYLVRGRYWKKRLYNRNRARASDSESVVIS